MKRAIYITGSLSLKGVLITLLALVPLLLSSCGSSSPEMILKPEILYRSPQLDFTQVQTVAVLPVNNYQNEVPEVSGLINDGLPTELRGAQKAWNVISYDEVLRKVNEKGLGRGYQNYIADLNTYVQVAGGTPNFTAETLNFFEQLKKEMNFQALLFTSYGYSEQAGATDYVYFKVKSMEFTPFNGQEVKPESDVIVQKPLVICNRATSGGALGCKTLRDTQRSVSELPPESESAQRTHALS